MTAALMRGLASGSVSETLVITAWICLVVFACIGAAVGAVAGWIVEQSVRDRVLAELEAVEPGGSDAAETK